MITKNEITALNLSPTKKDFVQIWNELIEVAGRLSERWDPTSTNESDPGIVILKALTGIADKLNYNIDKNTLEAFMPTAAQEESMRKLCDMLGYNVKYYRSAETDVTIKYHNSEPTEDEATVMQYGLEIPKFTVITNSDQDVNYFTTKSIYISTTNPHVTVSCMEGQIVKCESTTDNNVITTSHISDNNRFYLPEYQIAENGIFVYNVTANGEDGDAWNRVDNLNIQARGLRVFKFGFDSYEGRPYLEFPEDYSELINDGLYIYYARTSGANGNISVRTLSQLEPPNTDNWNKVASESFSAENTFSATTGSDIETISQAYNNFKKTIGTFNTLVTCRDYMNNIYNMTKDNTGKSIVSNALVTDIRTDLNRAITICSCDDAGIFYKETSLLTSAAVLDSKSSRVINSTEETETNKVSKVSEANKPVFNPNRTVNNSNWFLGTGEGLPLAKAAFIDPAYVANFSANTSGTVEADGGFWWIVQGGSAFRFKTVLPVENLEVDATTVVKTITNTDTIIKNVETSNAIDHFDLVLYPFKSYNQIKSNAKNIQSVYDKSFEHSSKRDTTDITAKLNNSDIKTIAHNIILPRKKDILSINNYLRLNAIIGTVSKITNEEGELLKEKIKIALANAFNLRELDFGEEIPFDSILKVIENADARISVVSLAEPALYTTFSVYEDDDSAGNPITQEYAVASSWLSDTYANNSSRFTYINGVEPTPTFDSTEAKKIYNKLAVRNVLAGRVPLFKYNNSFVANFADSSYKVTDTLATKPEINLAKPDAENPFTVFTENGVTYTGQLLSSNGINEIVYTKTYVPEQYKDNVIVKDTDDNTNYTDLETNCEISLGTDGVVDLELVEGEFVKFRAPNFITDKTYPAYVNYHLQLNSDIQEEAKDAEAYTLYNLLVTDDINDIRKDAVCSYFAESSNKKKITLTQEIIGTSAASNQTTGGITITVQGTSTQTETPANILAKSGFIKFNGKAKVMSTATILPSIPDLHLYKNNALYTVSFDNREDKGRETNYITEADVLSAITGAVDTWISSQNTATLPEQNWTISYELEYIPFEPESCKEWDNFIKASTNSLGFYPEYSSYGSALWRVYTGSYEAGKFILPGGASKLMPFTASHFGLLGDNRLSYIYIAKSLGKDAVPIYINNDAEYQLRAGEYLYIEYTPSTTAEDGSQQAASEPIKEVLGEGSIIKPSGFEGNGLISTRMLEQGGATFSKTVSFNVKDGATATKEVNMYSLGVNEQIAVRELSKTALDSETLSNSSTIYVYKNFNDCEALEKATFDDTGKRINNYYTLKDGEYVFYTDANKSEFAFYTTGTEVALEGRSDIVLPKCEIIDISTVFENGIDEIPWVALTFNKNDSLSFQEFQYITIGPNDTLKYLKVAEDETGDANVLTSTWRTCLDAAYIVAGEDTSTKLANINLTDDTHGNGWEVCSLLELNASPTTAQTLRTIPNKINTSVTLYKTPASGTTEREEVITLSAKDESHPISFKTNLACISSSGKLNINELYSEAGSLELKVLADNPPAIVKTRIDKLVPYTESDSVVDIATWSNSSTKTFATKGYGEIWTRVPFDYLASPAVMNSQEQIDNGDGKYSKNAYDNALKMSVSLLPNTYGVFCIYLNYGGLDAANSPSNTSPSTWIELMPGVSEDTVAMFNDPTAKYENNKLLLRPGINCLRVNNTCDIFIKTSLVSVEDDTDNAVTLSNCTLFFDDLRLVDCQPIEHIENGEKILQKTQGLNLAQIGYLDTEQFEALNSFDLQIRRNLRKEYTQEAITALQEINKQEDTNANIAENTLVSYKTRVSELVDFLEAAKNELTTLLNNSSNETIDALFTKYNELRKDLEQEQALKDAIIASKNTDDLEKQLVELLVSLDDAKATTKQALFDNLDTLDSIANSNADTFDAAHSSKGIIFGDFEQAATLTDTQLLADLKLFSLKSVNAAYAKELAKLAEMIDDNADKTALLALLNDANLAKYSSLLTDIAALVATKQTAISELIADLRVVADGEPDSDTGVHKVDYILLRTTLANLLDHIAVADVSDLLAELNAVLNSEMLSAEKYTALREYIKELTDLLAEAPTTVSDNYAAVRTAIDELLSLVLTKINANDNSYDNAIVSAINNISTKSITAYNNKLSDMLAQLQTELDNIKDSYEEAINMFDQDADIIKALKQQNSARAEEIDKISSVDSATTTSDVYTLLPYGTAAVLAVWPSYMKRDYMVGISKLYRDVRNAINSDGTIDSLVIDSNFYVDGTERAALVAAANIPAFTELFEQTKSLKDINTQSVKRIDLINSLGALITHSSTLYDSLIAIRDDSDTYAKRNLVLQQLIRAWQSATTVTRKQSVLAELITELESVIAIDTRLVEISAGLLCPSILLFPKCNISNTEDKFYSRLSNYVYASRSELSKIISGFRNKLDNNGILGYITNAYIINKNLLEALKEEDVTKFNYLYDVHPVVNSDTLLTKEFIDELIKFRDIVNTKDQIAATLTSKLLYLLTKDLTVAWEDSSYNWLDSSCNYYQKYIANTWTAYPVDGTDEAKTAWQEAEGAFYDENNTWRTHDGLAVAIDAKRPYGDNKSWQDSTGVSIEVTEDTNTNNVWFNTDGSTFEITNEAVLGVVTDLLGRVSALGTLNYMSDEAKVAHNILWLETQLLNELRTLDRNNEFYYNVPVEANVAINFNESESTLNTLMNPAVNYDINNINNNFVLSKIDINYLTNGLQIARSSKLN